MIKITQGMDIKEIIGKQFSKNSKSRIKVCRELLADDKEKLIEKCDNAKNKYDRFNLYGIIRYLEDFEEKVDSNNWYKTTWKVDNDIIRCFPVNPMNFPEYNIRMSNYFEADKGTFLRVSFPRLTDIIAFEMIKEDLDCDIAYIESKMSKYDVMYMHSAEVLDELLNEYEPYKDACVMAIGESQYYDKETGKAYNYFQTQGMEVSKYKEVVDLSCRQVVSIIAASIMEEVPTAIKYKLVEVDNDSITFYVSNEEYELGLRSYLMQRLCISCIGRRFEIVPTIDSL